MTFTFMNMVEVTMLMIIIIDICRIRIFKQEIKILKGMCEDLHRARFRAGDPVYVNLETYDPEQVYYLIQEYGSDGWYVNTKRENTGINVRMLVPVSCLSKEPPKTCPTCKQLLKRTQYAAS